MLREQTHLLDHLLHLPNPVGLVLKEVEVIEALGDDIVHGGPLVQGRGGVLEDHLDVADDLPVQGVRDFSGNADTLVVDLTARQGIDPDDGAADGGLAGTGLAHQGEGLPLVDVKGSVLNGADRVVPLAEGNVHIFQGQQNFPAVFCHRPMLRQAAGTGLIFLFQCSHGFLLPPKY